METIEQRLENLERHVRRTRRSNRVLSFALVVVICIAGAQFPDPKPQAKTATPPEQSLPDDQKPKGPNRLQTVEAEQLVLVDRLGRPRIRMTVTDAGPAISMLDEKGKRRLELNQKTDASGVTVLDAHEAPVAALQVRHADDRAQLEVASSQGSSRTSADGFSVRDTADNTRLLLALINGNFPVLGINQSGQSGPASVELTASEDGTRGLRLHDRSGFPLFSVSAAQDGTTHLDMRHPHHERALQVSSGPKNHTGPQIQFFSPARRDGTGGLLAGLQLGLRTDQQPFIRIVDGDGRSLFNAPAK